MLGGGKAKGRRSALSQQTITFDGSYNVGVQAHGDGITVNVNLPYLHLVRRHLRLRSVRKDLDLLNPYSRGVPLVGRREELARLKEEWLGSGAPISVRCLIGRAGSGKTRLALELCQAAHDEDWLAGFAEQHELARFAAQQNLGTWGWPKPTLLVVDYAAASAQVLRRWLAELAEHPGGPERPLRLLLLERHADPHTGWWRELTGPGGWSEAGAANLLDPAAPVPLDPLADREERRALLEEVMARASDLAGTEPLRPPPRSENAAFDARLANPSLEFEPLYLLMAGVTAVQQRVPHVLALTRTDLAERLAGRELDRIADLAAARGLDGDFAKHIAACLTLRGGCGRDGLEESIAEEQEALHYRNAGDPPAVAKLLHDALPGQQTGTVAAVLPDLIGEAAVLAALEDRSPAQQQAVVRRAYARAPAETLAAVIRTAQDYARTDEHPALLWLDELAQATGDLGVLVALVDQLPRQTTSLRRRAADFQAAIVVALRLVPEDMRGEEWRDRLAGALNDLANRLSALGQHEEALKAVEEAVALRHELAAARPNAFRPQLAGSLANLANRLSALDRHEEALAAAEAAAAVYRELAATRPDLFCPQLAGSLNNLANRLRALDRHEEALKAVEAAVAVYHQLAAARPDAFRPERAGSLHNLASCQSTLGRHEEALAAAENAVALRRELVASHSDAFRPDLAASLAVLANCLAAVGRVDEALATDGEAIEKLSRPFCALPQAFERWMTLMVMQYLQRCEKLGREPDEKLLAPITDTFEKMQGR